MTRPGLLCSVIWVLLPLASLSLSGSGIEEVWYNASTSAAGQQPPFLLDTSVVPVVRSFQTSGLNASNWISFSSKLLFWPCLAAPGALACGAVAADARYSSYSAAYLIGPTAVASPSQGACFFFSVSLLQPCNAWTTTVSGRLLQNAHVGASIGARDASEVVGTSTLSVVDCSPLVGNISARESFTCSQNFSSVGGGLPLTFRQEFYVWGSNASAGEATAGFASAFALTSIGFSCRAFEPGPAPPSATPKPSATASSTPAARSPSVSSLQSVSSLPSISSLQTPSVSSTAAQTPSFSSAHSPTKTRSRTFTVSPSSTPPPSRSLTQTWSPSPATTVSVSAEQTASASPLPSSNSFFVGGGASGSLLVVSSSTGITEITCPPPASSRCVGRADSSGNASSAPFSYCGMGYTGLTCAQCSPGFYVASSGACFSCPASLNGDLDLILPSLYFIAALLGMLALNSALVLLTQRLYGGTCAGGMRRAHSFAASVVSLVAILSQAALTGRSELPAALSTLYDYMSLVRLETVTQSTGALPPSCVGSSNAFFQEYVFFGLASVALGAVSLLTLVPTLCLPASCRWLQLSPAPVKAATPPISADGAQEDARCVRILAATLRIGFTLCVLLYPATTVRAVASISCVATVMTATAYMSLPNQDGSTLLAAGLSSFSFSGIGGNASGTAPLPSSTNVLLSVSVLSSNPGVVCFEGQHIAVSIMAIVILVVFAVLFPIATAWWSRRRTGAIVLRSLVAGEWLRAKEQRKSSRHNNKSEWRGCCCCCCCARRSPAALSSVSAAGANDDAGRFQANPSFERSVAGGVSPRRRGSSLSPPPPSPTPLPPRAVLLDPDDIVDEHPLVLQDRGITFFTASDYRASASSYRQFDLLAMLLVGSTNAVLVNPRNTFEAAIRLAAIAVVALALLGLILAWRPFSARDSGWKMPLRICVLVVICLIATLNFFVFLHVDDASRALSASDTTSTAVLVLSYVVFASCMALFLALVVLFWAAVLVRGAIREEKGEDPFDPNRALQAGMAVYKSTVARFLTLNTASLVETAAREGLASSSSSSSSRSSGSSSGGDGGSPRSSPRQSQRASSGRGAASPGRHRGFGRAPSPHPPSLAISRTLMAKSSGNKILPAADTAIYRPRRPNGEATSMPISKYHAVSYAAAAPLKSPRTGGRPTIPSPTEVELEGAADNDSDCSFAVDVDQTTAGVGLRD